MRNACQELNEEALYIYKFILFEQYFEQTDL